MKKHILPFLLLLFVGCSDSGEVFVQDKKILDAKIECMGLTVFPPDEKIEDTLNSLYGFNKECPYNMVVSYKSGIVCNSNQNSDKKAQGLPSSYLRMEIKKEGRLLYTYYKDLKHNLESNDVKKGFEVIDDDLNIIRP